MEEEVVKKERDEVEMGKNAALHRAANVTQTFTS